MTPPLVSFVLFAYNTEKYIREAVSGALSQTYSPLEIILSDDCSTDRTFEIMQEMAANYQGPHKIVLNRNPQNFGIGRHYNKFMELASGEIIELAAGDDISLPKRTAHSVDILLANPRISAVSLGLIPFEGSATAIVIPEEHEERVVFFNTKHFITDVDFHVNAPARAFRKYTSDYFGPLTKSCPVEDTPNLFRCLLHGEVAYSSRPAVLYRMHEASAYSTTNRFKISFQDIYADYENTLDVALEKNLIDSATCLWMHENLKRKLAQRLVLMRVEGARSKLVAFLIYILPAKCFTVRDKIVRFYRLIRRF
jgi:glycosyltransferase involved in cell wall biosynthesis